MFQLLRLQPSGLRPRRPGRLVNKDGGCNVELAHGERRPLLTDVWTTVVEIRWRFVLALFVSAFAGSWFVFGLLWYSIARANGDLSAHNRTESHVRCIDNVHGLTTAFLYSLETQTTIGYGGRALTGACAGSVALLVLQTLVGVFINCFMCGLVLAKISLPKKRAKSVAFSDKAVVCVKSGRLCLLIRVANLRKTLLIGSHVSAKLVRARFGAEGNALVLEQLDLRFTVDSGTDGLFFVCPLTLCHVIDRSSPLFALSADSLPQQDFELVVFLDGTAESTSSSCQVRTSYTPQEVLWGHAFLPVVSMTTAGKYRVDFSNFSRSVAVRTPHCARCFANDKHENDKHDNDEHANVRTPHCARCFANDKHANDKHANDKHDNDKHANDKHQDEHANDKHGNDKPANVSTPHCARCFTNDKHANDKHANDKHANVSTPHCARCFANDKHANDKRQDEHANNEDVNDEHANVSTPHCARCFANDKHRDKHANMSTPHCGNGKQQDKRGNVRTPHCVRCFAASDSDIDEFRPRGVDNPGFSAGSEDEVSSCSSQDDCSDLCTNKLRPHQDTDDPGLAPPPQDCGDLCTDELRPHLNELRPHLHELHPPLYEHAPLCLNNIHRHQRDLQGVDNPSFTAIDIEDETRESPETDGL